jgi:hypothetical protein
MTIIKKISRKHYLAESARRLGLTVSEWSPGDGVTRYRFFDKPGNSYFGPDTGIYTALGISEAETFLAGYNAK